VDWGVITAIVAAVFAAMGIVIGLFMAKLLSGKGDEEEKLAAVEERIQGITERISEAVESLKEKLLNLREEKLYEVKKELSSLEEDLLRLKKEVATLPLTSGSLEAIERAELLLKELDFNLPTVDNSLLTQIKDNLIILRNDVQSLMQSQLQREEPRPELPFQIDDLLLSVKTALRLSKRINAALVKDELISLASSIKGDLGSELVKDLDDQALSSKELVLILEQVKKELEGAKKGVKK